jgi:hypothetical protein
LNNKQVRVRDWYEPVARQLIQQATASGRPLRLIVDGTRIGSQHQLLIVAIAFRRRALPLAWTWLRCRRGHSAAEKQLALLGYVHRLLPEQQEVQLVGDSEFGAVPVLAQLDAWSWHYAFRQKGRLLLWDAASARWQRFDTLLTKAGQSLWQPSSQFTRKHGYGTNVLAVWRTGEKAPWFLVTNLPNPAMTLRLYTRRMWIEEMFADFKRNGFDLEAIRLRHFLRLSRFTLAVALLYVWVVAFGTQTIKRGLRHFVDRSKQRQRQLSIFRIGYDMLERCLLNGDAFSLRLIPYF